MDNSIVCPGFSIGLALDDKDVAADQISCFFQNCFRAVTLDAELRAIGDQARLQACGQIIFVGGPDFLPLRVDQLVAVIESQEYRISRFLERASIVKYALPIVVASVELVVYRFLVGGGNTLHRGILLRFDNGDPDGARHGGSTIVEGELDRQVSTVLGPLQY